MVEATPVLTGCLRGGGVTNEGTGVEGETNVEAPLTATPVLTGCVLGGGVTKEGTGVDGTEGDEA